MSVYAPFIPIHVQMVQEKEVYLNTTDISNCILLYTCIQWLRIQIKQVVKIAGAYVTYKMAGNKEKTRQSPCSPKTYSTLQLSGHQYSVYVFLMPFCHLSLSLYIAISSHDNAVDKYRGAIHQTIVAFP
jgi:hypothetical protein